MIHFTIVIAQTTEFLLFPTCPEIVNSIVKAMIVLSIGYAIGLMHGRDDRNG